MNREEKENQFESEDEDDEEDYFLSDKGKYDVSTINSDKRNKHNCSERKRRNVIRDAFDNLKKLIPSVRLGAQQGRGKPSRAHILKQAAEYVISLQATQEHYTKRLEDMREETARMENEVQELENGGTYSSGISGINNFPTIQVKTEGGIVISSHGVNNTHTSTLTPQVISTPLPQNFINFENHFEVSKFLKTEDPDPDAGPSFSSGTQSLSVPSCSNVSQPWSTPSPSSFLQSETHVSYSAASSLHSYIKCEPDDDKVEPFQVTNYDSSSDDASDCDYFLGPKRFKIN